MSPIKQIEIYFDMDGVLADFDSALKNDEYVQRTKEELDNALKQYPELSDIHHDQLKKILKGPQEDPGMKALKKAYYKHRKSVYSAANKKGYFANLDVLPGAERMLKFAAKLSGKLPHILTAPIASNKHCEPEKREWAERNFSGLYNKFLCTPEKHQFAKSKYSILIDDRPKYVNAFREAGGMAILHTSPDKTMEQLKKVVNSLVKDGMNESAEEVLRKKSHFINSVQSTTFGNLEEIKMFLENKNQVVGCTHVLVGTPKAVAKELRGAVPVNTVSKLEEMARKGTKKTVVYFDFVANDEPSRGTRDVGKKIVSSLKEVVSLYEPCALVLDGFVDAALFSEGWNLIMSKLGFKVNENTASAGVYERKKSFVNSSELDLLGEEPQEELQDTYGYVWWQKKKKNSKHDKDDTEGDDKELRNNDEDELDEFSALGAGAVVGYGLPLGMKPDYHKLGTANNKNKSPKRWYDVHRESKDDDGLEEEYLGTDGGVRYFQIGGSLPDELYNRTNDGKPTRDPGIAAVRRKRKKKRK